MVESRESRAKRIIQKSGLPGDSFSVNTFSGCSHACVYCYATFMRRFLNRSEPWGTFADPKVNAAALFSREIYRLRSGGEIFFGSVTDVYQPLEKKYRFMRSILEELVRRESSSDFLPGIEPEDRPEIHCTILTKSDLVLRDLELLGQLSKVSVGFSITLLDERARHCLEPGAVSISRRLLALKKLHDAGIRTFVFINPYLPGLTPLEEIFKRIAGRADSVFGETLNTHCGNLSQLVHAIEQYDSDVAKEFRRLLHDRDHSNAVKCRFVDLAQHYGIKSDGFWDHSQ